MSLSLVITTNEPRNVRDLFKDKTEMPMGFDMLLLTKRCPFPIERKEIPGDLLASVDDGRLNRELIAMREVNPTLYLLLLVGKFKFRGNDLVMPSKKMRVWSKKGIRNLMRSLVLFEGCVIETAEDDQEMVAILNEWQDYLDATSHRSIRCRPGFTPDYSRSEKMQYEERVKYFYQGLPDIKAGRAEPLQKKFPKPLDLYAASVEDIMTIDGFGKKLAQGIYNFLRGV